MALIEMDMFGSRCDKVKTAVDRIRAFCPDDGYFLGFSGGKDSVVIKALCDLANAKHDAHYSVTTVDPPELVRFIKNNHEDVLFDRPVMTMRQLIVKKMFPPTRLQRYCCEFLKETHGIGRVTMTGVRWAESKNRKDNQGLVTIMDDQRNRNVTAAAENAGANFTKTVRGGVILNLDNDAERRTVEHCYRTNKTLVNPIIDWKDSDIWEFIRYYNVPYCSLYDEGFKRLGCIGCPLGGFPSQKREFTRWPQYKTLYIRTFDEMLIARKAAGMPTNELWHSGEGVFRWWTGEYKNHNPEQITFDELGEGLFD